MPPTSLRPRAIRRGDAPRASVLGGYPSNSTALERLSVSRFGESARKRPNLKLGPLRRRTLHRWTRPSQPAVSKTPRSVEFFGITKRGPREKRYQSLPISSGSKPVRPPVRSRVWRGNVRGSAKRAETSPRRPIHSVGRSVWVRRGQRRGLTPEIRARGLEPRSVGCDLVAW